MAIAQVRLGNSDNPEGTYSAGARHAARFTDYKSNGKYLVYYTMASGLCKYLHASLIIGNLRNNRKNGFSLCAAVSLILRVSLDILATSAFLVPQPFQ